MKKTLLVFAFGLISLGFVRAQNTHSGDTYVIGSMAIGYDVDNPTSFGLNTLVFKEKNLRVLFDDATDSDDKHYSYNDWKITINDSKYDGASFFRIDDVTGGFELFKLMAGSRDNALVTNGDNVGLGTDEPDKGLHLVYGNAPTFRLEQDVSKGLEPYIWDMVGRDSYFSISDITAGGSEPFKIMPNSSSNVLVIKDENVGIGTDSPSLSLHVKNGNSPSIRLEQDGSDGYTPTIWDIGGNESAFFIRDAYNSSALPFVVATGQTNNVLVLRNNRVGIGTWSEDKWDPDATLHLNGFMRFEPQDAAPSTAGAGDVYFDKTSLGLKYHSGTEWLSLEPNTDSQELSLSSDILSVSGGTNTIDLSGYLDNTDSQTLDLSDNNLSVSNGNSVDLSSFLDNTDSQTLSLSGTSLSIDNGNSVDLSTLQDGYEANTDNQELSILSDVLSISGGTKTINLSSYLDNTDSQALDLSGNTLSVSNGNSVDLSSYLDNTDAQNITLSGTSLSIDNGNSVDLSTLQDGYEANTDEQSLSLSGTNLSISGGNTVDLSSVAIEGTDDQTLSLSGTTLSIESGNSVDLNSLLEDIYNRLDEQASKITEQENTIEQLESKTTEQENTIAQLQTEIAHLKSLHNDEDDTETSSGAMLYQNYPNPSNGATRIDYFLPETVSQASLMIYDLRGRILKNIPLNNRGEGSVEIAGSELENGQYLYTLLTDGSRVETKKMLFVK